MAARTGERNVTPVPRRDVEMLTRGSGPVIRYTLSPEELEKYKGGSGEMAKGVKAEINMTKEQYLQRRLSGETRTQIFRKLGVGQPTFYGLLKEWGIREVDAEERELELLVPMRQMPKVEPPDEEHRPANNEQELAELQAAVALWKNDAERKGEYITDLEGELTKLREEKENEHARMIAVTREQANEIFQLISFLKEAKSRATVISDQAGVRIAELEDEIGCLKQGLSVAEQASRVLAPVFGDSVTIHVPIVTGTDPVRERLNVYRGLDALGGTFESTGLDRERIMRELFELLQTVVGFVATDIAELLPGQDVTEHVQRFFWAHNQQVFGSLHEAV